MLENINFTICIIDNGNRYTTITCYPSEYRCLSNLLRIYQSRDRIVELINRIRNYAKYKKPSIDLGENDYSLVVTGDKTIYEFTAGDFEPIHLETSKVIELFEKYLIWLDRYENCELPGVIPESKLETWSCVPNEHIKDEYRKKKFGKL